MSDPIWYHSASGFWTKTWLCSHILCTYPLEGKQYEENVTDITILTMCALASWYCRPCMSNTDLCLCDVRLTRTSCRRVTATCRTYWRPAMTSSRRATSALGRSRSALTTSTLSGRASWTSRRTDASDSTRPSTSTRSVWWWRHQFGNPVLRQWLNAESKILCD